MRSPSFRITKPGKTGTRVFRINSGNPAGIEERPDHVATEEPLEIRLVQRATQRATQGETTRTVAVTMRTPGADPELALGFLFAEGVIAHRGQVLRASPCKGPDSGCANILEVELAPGVPQPELAGLDRHFFSTSACGVCGKAGLEALKLRATAEIPPGPVVSPEIIAALPDRLRQAQGLFDATGGLHAAALFDAEGNLLAAREDVGRHNALDKVIGWAFQEDRLPLHDHIVMVSGRSSYEILQKSLVAGIPVVCAVSAPSSLAVELAEDFGITLIGFLRGDRFNVYSGVERIAGTETARPVRREPLFRTV